MKTIEEKAKAYDEALSRAESLYDNESSSADTLIACEAIFPELTESEDEKVRKEIKQLIQGMHDADPRKERWLTWLEKQGEKKHFDYENANIQQKDFAPQEDAPRYSIGDVLCDKSCTTLNKDAQPNYEIVDIRNGLYICDKGYIPISQQDEYELVAKKIEQKPTNEEMIETLRTEYEKGRADAIAETQKDWSKEDEKILRTIISDGIRGAEFDMVQVNWLKSLKDRYIWKPSDGQMEALHDLNLTGNISYAGQGQELINLYNDLKKLKEE